MKNFPWNLSHAGTEHAEHIQIIITSMENADNVIPTLDQLLSTIWVRVIKTTVNIRINYPHVFCVGSGPDQ